MSKSLHTKSPLFIIDAFQTAGATPPAADIGSRPNGLVGLDRFPKAVPITPRSDMLTHPRGPRGGGGGGGGFGDGGCGGDGDGGFGGDGGGGDGGGGSGGGGDGGPGGSTRQPGTNGARPGPGWCACPGFVMFQDISSGLPGRRPLHRRLYPDPNPDPGSKMIPVHP